MSDLALETTFSFEAKYKSGLGKASKAFGTFERQESMRSVFGIPLIGTFNLKPFCDVLGLLDEIRPSYEVEDRGVLWSWHLCKVCKGDLERYAWILRWRDGSDRAEPNHVELASRKPLPDDFWTGTLTVSVFSAWDEKQVAQWLEAHRNFKWHQTFSWCPGRGDGRPRAKSWKLWEKMEGLVAWEGARVLDIGCHTGYFSFETAKAGAIVTGCDINPAVLQVARDIAHHVEKQDVTFVDVDDPGGQWDTIICLSVIHQIDPGYLHLAEKVNALKCRCRHLFFELIVPPLEGRMDISTINRMVGASPVVRYKHAIRKMRSLYYLEGEA